MIYETSGRAREYFELAANLYSGCEHACVYCYGADVTRKAPVHFFGRAVPRRYSGKGPLQATLVELERDAFWFQRKYKNRHILLSFVTDPYQPAEAEYQLTRQAIKILHEAGLMVAILTKGGLFATRDFDLLSKDDCFGVTLTFINQERSLEWEPGAAIPIDRMLSLEEAHKRGISTWVSLEPVISPVESLDLIDATAKFVDVFKVGKLNYSNKLPLEFWEQVKDIDWRKFALDVVEHLDALGVNYYIKRDLAEYIGRPDGITKGNVPK